MARIRTIKPEFWTDERLTECSLSARLLFIGMLNFADDNGNQAYSAKRLKMQIFPADAIDTQPLLDDLISHGVVIAYSVDGENYLHIKGFAKHQVINRPSATKIPMPKLTEDSVSGHGEITDGEEGKGREGKGIKPFVPSVAGDPSGKPDCPHQEIIALYHEVLPQCPQVRDWTTARATQLRARWNEDPKRQNLDYWRGFFEYVKGCDFLVGRAGKEPFFADLEWMTKSSNFTKIREAKYENRRVA